MIRICCADCVRQEIADLQVGLCQDLIAISRLDRVREIAKVRNCNLRGSGEGGGKKVSIGMYSRFPFMVLLPSV